MMNRMMGLKSDNGQESVQIRFTRDFQDFKEGKNYSVSPRYAQKLVEVLKVANMTTGDDSDLTSHNRMDKMQRSFVRK